MLKNYITEDYLKDILPDLDSYRWDSQTDLSNYFRQANNEIYEDLRKRNLKINKLMPELSLRDSGSSISDAGVTIEDSLEDTLNRLRYVYNVTTFTGTEDKTITLQGSSDNETFEDVETFTITETGEISGRIFSVYQYYRVKVVNTDGTIDYSFKLVEAVYDDLFAYKILELIMRSVKKDDKDSIHLKEIDFANIYQSKVQTSIFLEDTEDSFTNSGFKETQANTITMLK